MKNNTFEIECSYMGEVFSITIDDSVNTESEVLEALQDMKKERFENESGEDIETDLEESFEVDNWGDVPTWAQDWNILSKLMPEFYSSYYDIEIFEAANDCGIDFSDVEEAYSGEFNSDEDFAENFANDCGYLNNTQNWPFNCIDWEQAAKELMYDYSNANNHYFRNI